MEDYMLFMAGMAMAAIIFYALSELNHPAAITPGRIGRAPGHRGARGFSFARGDVFKPRVIALEFDEMGPGMSVNGEYHNSFERTRVDMVAADVSAPGGDVELISGDGEEDENLQEEKRIGDLVNLTGPTWLEEDQYGMFRAPMRDGEKEEALADILDKVDEQAEKMIAKRDAEAIGGYALDDESMKSLAGEFVADTQVAGMLEQIERMFIWRAGSVMAKVWFLDPDDGVIDEIPVSFQLREEDSAALRRNIQIMAANSLRAELGLDLLEYHVVVIESAEENRP
ncbi:MAG: hypothetical protein OEV92_08775 [Nitrospinota bacterium]|nr:hypothetical protein [Nitrospinota bacterium]